MDIQSDSQSIQAISDDQELAKVLAGVGQTAGDGQAADPVEESILPAPPTPMPTDPAPADSVVDATGVVAEPEVDPLLSAAPVLEPAVASVSTDSGDVSLDNIKQQALGELRPLVDKLNVSPEEKFDTYLLLLRSTDDKALIAPAHEAAKSIADEAKRAQALLDIIKEIDFLSQSQ